MLLGAGCSFMKPDSTVPAKTTTSSVSDSKVPTSTNSPIKKSVVPAQKPTPKTFVYITITPTSFEPAAVEVKPGTTVVWTNKSNEEHTVTAYDGSFDSGSIPPGGTYKHTFTRPVSYSYYCTFHHSMQGTIIAPR
jgi:plastocyanin